MTRGFWTIGRLAGAPVRFHWTVPVGALVMSRFTFAPAYWVGFIGLVLAHEVGHALLVLRYRLRVREIVVHGVGGYCAHDPARSAWQDGVIAWGGVLAQLVLLLVAAVVLLVTGRPTTIYGQQLAHVLTESNLFLIAINLLPIEPLDGRKAWSLLGMLWAKRRALAGPARNPWGTRRTVQDELRAVEKLDTESETPSQRTERIVRDLISRTTQPK